MGIAVTTASGGADAQTWLATLNLMPRGLRCPIGIYTPTAGFCRHDYRYYVAATRDVVTTSAAR